MRWPYLRPFMPPLRSSITGFYGTVRLCACFRLPGADGHPRSLTLVTRRDDGRAAGRRLCDTMSDHAAMQGANGVASSCQAEPREQAVHEAGEGTGQHAAAEAEGRAHVLQVGFVDRGGMVDEAAKHSFDSRRKRGKTAC